MIELHLPWLELAVLAPLVGAIVALGIKDAEKTRLIAIFFSGLALIFALSAWEDFNTLKVFEAHDRWDLVSPFLGPDALVVDEFNAPLLALTALMFFLTPLATLRTKLKRFPFRMNLVSEFLMLATLACRSPWGIIVLMGLQTLPVVWEIRNRGKSARGFIIHMVLFVALFVIGWAMIDAEDSTHEHSITAITLLTLAVLIRSGCAPLHCWMTDLFEKATLGSSLLFVSPMIGAYAAVRLVLPVAPDWSLRIIALASLFTAVYSAGMAMVQTETRRFFCYLLLSNASLVLVGLEVVTPIGLTGALCTWLAVSLSLTGFGLTLRAIESRVGRLSLRDFHGLYEQMPTLATFFLLTGLAIVGFPGTVGFAGVELIVEGAVDSFSVRRSAGRRRCSNERNCHFASLLPVVYRKRVQIDVLDGGSLARKSCRAGRQRTDHRWRHLSATRCAIAISRRQRNHGAAGSAFDRTSRCSGRSSVGSSLDPGSTKPRRDQSSAHATQVKNQTQKIKLKYGSDQCPCMELKIQNRWQVQRRNRLAMPQGLSSI